MSAPRFDKPGYARFLTFSCYKRMPLLDEGSVRHAFVSHVEMQRERLGFLVLAWVVMPEHVHLIVVPENGEIGPVLRGIKQGFGQRTIQRWREEEPSRIEALIDPRGQARFWQRGGGYDRNVRDVDELREKILYVHQNPVRRGLVERAGDWVWSSARDFEGEDGAIRIVRV